MVDSAKSSMPKNIRINMCFHVKTIL